MEGIACVQQATKLLYSPSSFSPAPAGFHTISKKTGESISADVEEKVRRFAEVKETSDRLFIAGEKAFENVDRGALEKVGQRRRRRGIFARYFAMLFDVGKGFQGKRAAGTMLARP
jgi:hypothetical protein